jgi:hypothetical protein
MAPRRSGLAGGIPSANNLGCEVINDAGIQQLLVAEPMNRLWYDTITVSRGDLTAGTTLVDSNTASNLPAGEIFLDAESNLHLPFFKFGLADRENDLARSLRDTNVWGGKNGSLDRPGYPHHIRGNRRNMSDLERAAITRNGRFDFTHLAIDVFNQDGTAPLDADLIDIAHGIVTLNVVYQGMSNDYPIELGQVCEFPGLFPSGGGSMDGDAALTAMGAATHATPSRIFTKLQEGLKGLIVLPDYFETSDEELTRVWLEIVLPFDNKTAVQGAIFHEVGFTQLDDGDGNFTAALEQPAFQARVSAWAPNQNYGTDRRG